MSTIAVNSITDASGGTTASINGYTPSASNMTGRNRIINGDMRIDQRNAGAAVTLGTGSQFAVDRFSSFENSSGGATAEQSSEAPASFNKSLLVTVTSAASSLGATDYVATGQAVEGYNMMDFNWGTSNAKTVTLSFWVRSSVTGTFSASVRNSAANRSYVFTYTINSANTWQKIEKTITGDTSGTWLENNGVGLRLWFDLGAGSTYTTSTTDSWLSSNYLKASGSVDLISTSGATFYITGVQLEVGSAATEFEHRLYGQELALCQRYYQQRNLFNYNATTAFWQGYFGGGTGVLHIDLPVTMRAAPTLTVLQPTQVQVYEATGWTNRTIAAQFSSVDVAVFSINSTSVAEGKLLTLSGGSTAPTGKMSSEL